MLKISYKLGDKEIIMRSSGTNLESIMKIMLKVIKKEFPAFNQGHIEDE